MRLQRPPLRLIPASEAICSRCSVDRALSFVLTSAPLACAALPTQKAADALKLAAQPPPAMCVPVVSVRQANGPVDDAPDDLVLGNRDTLAMTGLPEPLSVAQANLLKG